MTPLPAPLGTGELVAWRLDKSIHAATWNTGEGAFRAGGRWNSRGVRAVYCSVDPATAILEVAVHVGFPTLDTVPHALTSLLVVDPERVHVLEPAAVPDPAWLRPGNPAPAQQAFGDRLLATHDLIVAPSVVSRNSWNLVFIDARAAGAYRLRTQEPFVIDPRLHPGRP
jgi:RES domain-containing protein